MAWIAYAAAWIATGTAVGISIFVTKDNSSLWALFIPALLSISVGDKEKKKSKED